MRLKEAIYNLQSHPMFNEIDKLMKCDMRTYFKRYNYRIWPYGKGYEYNNQMNLHLIDCWRKELPLIRYVIPFDYGTWGTVRAFIKVELNEYARDRAEVLHSIHFVFTDTRPRHFFNLKFEMPLTFDLDNPIPELKKMLKPHLFETGIIAELQKLRNETKKGAVKYYKLCIERHDKNHSSVNENLIYKKILKRFNIDSYLDLDTTIKFVNQTGTLAKVTKLERLDLSSLWNFDGDIDEIEEELDNLIEPGVIYV